MTETSGPRADIGLAFILASEPVEPDPDKLTAAAQRLLGVDLILEASGSEDSSGKAIQSYSVDGGPTLMVMMVDAPHPDVAAMPRGLTSPRAGLAEAAPAHYIVTALGLSGAPRQRDEWLARLTCAVVEASPAVAAMLGFGVMFHAADIFQQTVASEDQGNLPMGVCIDLTVATEQDGRLSFLTHGMPRYSREDLYVTAAAENGGGAFELASLLVRWQLSDPDKQFPTGDTVGRTAEEQIEVKRQASPIDQNTQVIRLDLE